MIYDKETIFYKLEEMSCQDCGGYGEYTVNACSDDKEWEKCENCNNGFVIK